LSHQKSYRAHYTDTVLIMKISVLLLESCWLLEQYDIGGKNHVCVCVCVMHTRRNILSCDDQITQVLLLRLVYRFATLLAKQYGKMLTKWLTNSLTNVEGFSLRVDKCSADNAVIWFNLFRRSLHKMQSLYHIEPVQPMPQYFPELPTYYFLISRHTLLHVSGYLLLVLINQY
jgi:hypothetical protein